MLEALRSEQETRILVGTVLEVETGPNVTALGRRRTFIVSKFDLGGGDMKVATINIRSVKLHTPEPPRPAAGGDGGERAAAATTTTTGEKPSHIQSLFKFSRRQHQTL